MSSNGSASPPKTATGIAGLDEITFGGLPAGRVTLVCGGPGCGKTLLGMEFAARGMQFGEPALFVSFEEPVRHLIENAGSLGFDLQALVADHQLVLDHVAINRRDLEEAGEYDLQGLFIRLDHAIASIGAKRVVLDTVEALFSVFSNEALLRSELRRLFGWLGERGVTSIVTAERGERTLTRRGLEEYVSDCVISLDHRVRDEIATRRMRIVKYRGSHHGTNEYPFIVDERGFSVLPITSSRTDLPASRERISTGVAPLDDMLGGQGLWRGSSVLLSGGAGSGKTTLATVLARAACRRGDQALIVLLEETPAEVARNLGSVGLDVAELVEQGSLRFVAERPSAFGLDAHLARILEAVRDQKPDLVVIDAITALTGDPASIEGALRRVVDMIKATGATVVLTSLTAAGADPETTQVGISSIIDTWLLLGNVEAAGERNRSIQVLKSRGTAHSNQLREFVLTTDGIDIRDVYTGGGGVLMGAARLTQEAADRARAAARAREAERRAAALAQRRTAIEAQIAALREELAVEEAQLADLAAGERDEDEAGADLRTAMASLRGGDGLVVLEGDPR